MSERAHKQRILIVDDGPYTIEIVQRNLASSGYQVFSASSVPDAISLLDSTPIDLVITDLKMPKVSGLDLVRHIRDNFPDMEVMMITGYASIEGAVEAVKMGAEEYLSKPFTDKELFSAVTRALDKLNMRRAAHAERQRSQMAPPGLIGESRAIVKVFDAIAKVAFSSATVLILGESGTGKELVARAIHYGGERASAPFVPVSCGAIPETLLESELFGHMKGSFTGASASRAGFFQTADGGTIFLDEIAETSLSMQVKLLRFLQDREVCMIGSNRPRKVNVRILAATNKDLLSLAKKGAFREDLYYRLDVLTIPIPSLREREGDIFLLAHHFVEKFAKELGKPTPEFSPRALELLRDYDWPGNVRELENVIQRLIIMSEKRFIDAPDLPRLMHFTAGRKLEGDRTLAEVESQYIRQILERVGNNKSRAADILGIDRKTLRQKLLRAHEKN